MKIIPTSLDNVYLAKGKSLSDHRGTFSRLFCVEALNKFLGKRQILQINQSHTKTVGAVRGMHYQIGSYAEMKLIRCLKGSVFDVAVNVETGEWVAQLLQASDHHMMIIPEGFAHGFQVLEPNSELLYLHTALYKPEFERGLNPLCPTLSIEWPMPVKDLSDRDKCHPQFSKEGQHNEMSPLSS